MKILNSDRLDSILGFFLGSLNTDSEQLVEALGLDFDPEIELKKRLRIRVPYGSQQKQQQPDIENKYLEQIREEIKT